jgi:hypothetical protein
LARSAAASLRPTDRPAADPRANRAQDRSALFDDRFLKTLEHLHMVSRKVFSGNPQGRLGHRVRRPPDVCARR